jgi:hypothetical protein
MEFSREDVLYSFAVEPDLGRETLERYMQAYPEYAAELVDLSYELSKKDYESNAPLSDEDKALIDKAWQKHCEASPTNSATEAES